MDFKSDEVAGEAGLEVLAGQYRPQMEAYRSALSRMLGLPPARVRMMLVFLQAGRTRVLGRPEERGFGGGDLRCCVKGGPCAMKAKSRPSCDGGRLSLTIVCGRASLPAWLWKSRL